MGGGDGGREVGGGVGPSLPRATGACTRRRGSCGGRCPFMGGCGRLWVIVGARRCVGCSSLSAHGRLWSFVRQRGRSLSWALDVAGCGGALVVVCAWAVVCCVSFVCQRARSSWGVVGRSSLSVCGRLWSFERHRGRSSCRQHAGLRWGAPRRGWGVLWPLVVVRIHVGVVVALVALYVAGGRRL